MFIKNIGEKLKGLSLVVFILGCCSAFIVLVTGIVLSFQFDDTLSIALSLLLTILGTIVIMFFAVLFTCLIYAYGQNTEKIERIEGVLCDNNSSKPDSPKAPQNFSSMQIIDSKNPSLNFEKLSSDSVCKKCGNNDFYNGICSACGGTEKTILSPCPSSTCKFCGARNVTVYPIKVTSTDGFSYDHACVSCINANTTKD